MKRALFIFFGVAVLIVALALIARMGGSERSSERPQDNTPIVGTLVSDTDSLEDRHVQVGEQKAGDQAPLIEFSQADYDYARAQGKKIALFFFSDWCSTCRNEIANEVIPAFDQLERDGLVGFLVNYDDRRTDADEDALAHEFQIPGRHTKVFLDTDGSVIRKTAPENWTTAQYLEVLEGLE